MYKSSFGQFGGRLSTGPLRVRNDGGNIRKSTAGSHTPQGKTTLSGFRNIGRNSAGSSGMGLRTSGIGGRSSGIGVRGSGIGARGRTDVMKDPRPISDKSFQHKCIRMLVDFLTENKYPHAISPKVLQSPPSREFFRIFEFIYLHLYPSFKLVGKMEEEVLHVFKSLGYPFTISKSYMYAVGTPHSWPYLLAALVWLVDLVKYTQSLANSVLLDQYVLFPNDEDFDSVPRDKILFEYTAQTYRTYLNGEDTYEALDEELSKVLENKYLGQSGGIEAVRAENARIAEEIELQEQELGRVAKLQEQQQIMLLDERKFRDYLSEVDGVIRKHQQMLQEAEEQQTSLTADLKSVQAKVQHMQAIYEQQEMTPADVERLRAARQELQRQEEGLEREVEDINTEIWKKEMAIARLHEQVDANIIEYSKLARALELIPSTAENAQGIDFELRSSFQEMNSNHHFENTIKPALVAMKKHITEKVHQAEAANLQEEHNIEQLLENVADMKQELTQLDKDIRSRDEELECRKQLYQRDTDNLQVAIDQLQQEIRNLQTSSQMSLQDAEKELRETYSWAEQQRLEMARQEQEHVSFMLTMCTLVSDHKTNVQQRLKELEKDMKQVLVQTQNSALHMEERSRKIRAGAEQNV